MIRTMKGMLLVLVLVMSTVSCSGTFNLKVDKTPLPAPGATVDAVATLDAAVKATLTAPRATPTTSIDVEATVQAAVAATVAAQKGGAPPVQTVVVDRSVPSAVLPAPAATSALLFSTYFGGGDSDRIRDLAVDGEGNVYVVGTTSSPDLPTTPGAYDGSYNGVEDAFLVKLSADGSTLLYSTYLGGSDEEQGIGLVVDDEGNVYVTGQTFSVDFPTTPGALDTTLNGGRDGFVAKLSAAGDLIYSTYLGGDNWDYGNCIAVDDAGSAYIGGFTHGGFPVTPGAAQATFGGSGDGFVAKLSPDGSSLVYSTYVGGSSWERIPGIAVDREGSAYIATGSGSFDFPTTPGAWDTVCEGCMISSEAGDAAAVKLSADGSKFIYSTFVGGTGCREDFFAVAVDPAGHAYFTGDSCSSDYPTTPGALQPAFHGGEGDVVVTKLNADGSDLLYSTYLGGAGREQGLGITVDDAGNATVAGYSYSVDFPTAFPLQPASGGGRDAFVVILNQDASALVFGTYFGGSGDESEGFNETYYIGLGLSTRGVYLASETSSTDMPTTAGAYDVSYNGGAYDGFVALLNPSASAPPTPPAPAPTAEASQAQLHNTWHVAVDGSDTTGDGSEANPFATIQHGIDVASHGDTVLVHPGTYKENINFRGKNITVGSLFVITGDEEHIQQTVIDGDRQGHVVTFAGGEDTLAELSGFTITNGYAQGASAPETHGGGVFCWSSGGVISGPTLTHLKVSGNEAVEEGGGLYFALCSPVIQDVSVTDNHAYGGGGMRFSYGSPTLENVIVVGNSAGHGGGLHFYHADATVTNALIADNSVSEKGGGMVFDGCSPTFVDVTVVGNSTAGHGGGLNVSYMSQPTLVNSIVWGNSPEQIYFDTDWPGEAVTIEHSDIQGGEAGIVTNGLGPVNWGGGNIDADPRFVDAGAGDYHLADDSPCLNAGKAAGAPLTDIEGNPRPHPAGSRPDLGAYESR
jgi:hypothetical protein